MTAGSKTMMPSAPEFSIFTSCSGPSERAILLELTSVGAPVITAKGLTL